MSRIVVATLGIGLLTAGCQVGEGASSSDEQVAAARDAVETVDATGTRRVWADAGTYASPSPDGRFVTFVDWTTGDVAMHDLETGEDRPLTDKGSWEENGSWAEEPVFSPDGERVAYAYGNTDRGGEPWRYELRIVRVDDPDPDVIYAISPEDRWMAPMDWSSEHGIATRVYPGDDSSELVLIDPETGEVTRLARYAAGEPEPFEAWFSPDDRRLAVRRGNHVFVRDLSDGTEVELDVAVGPLLGWMPDGKALLVHTSRLGQSGVWALPLDAGGASGDPLLVRAGLPGVAPAGRAGDRYFYGVIVDAPTIHRATIDPVAGRVLTEPVPITSPLDGRAGHPTWSPDGESMAYELRSPRESELRFMVKSTDGDEVREIASGDLGSGMSRGLHWGTDGGSLFFLKDADDRSPGLHRLDVETGEIVEEKPGRVGQAMDVVPGGGTAIVVATDPASSRRGATLVMRDLSDGAERVLATLPDPLVSGRVAVSPRGERAALLYRDPVAGVATLALVDLDDGEMRSLYSVSVSDRPSQGDGGPGLRDRELAWTPDGRNVLVVRRGTGEDGRDALLSVPVAGGDPTVIMDFEGRRNLALHPDGRRVAFVDGQLRSELWVIDSLTEALAAARERAN